MNLLRPAALIALLAAGRWAHAAPPLPENPRLAPVRAEIEALIAAAESESLPGDVLVSKVREGLAKGVAPKNILGAVRVLGQNLAKADRLVRASGRTNPSGALLRTLAEAEGAGIDIGLARPLVHANTPDTDLVRAVDALTELALRGYPRRQAAEVVLQVLVTDAAAMGRVVAGLEELRGASGMNRIDAVDALGRGLAAASTFEAALSLALEGPGSGNAPDTKRGRDRGHSNQGNSGAAGKHRHSPH